MPKIVWKAVSLYQCLIRRTLEAVDGLRLAWAADNLLTSITMARSLIEIGSLIRQLTISVAEATDKKDVQMLDDAVMSVSFANRLNIVEAGGHEFVAQNILSVIDRMDKQLFQGDKKKYGYRETYDFLSEFVHPNHYGILGLYCDHFPKESRIEFGNVAAKKRDILRSLRTTLGMVMLVDIQIRAFQSLIPRISEFVPK
jgi:hypothetical protein